MPLIVPNVRILASEDPAIHRLEIPVMYQVHWTEIEMRCWAKHNGYARVSIATPSKPRTFGPKKVNPDDQGYQSNHLNGHLSQLAIHWGYGKVETKLIMKDDLPEWPMEPRKIGKSVKLRPVSEALISTVVCSAAIEWCHRIASEEGIVLVEE